QGIYALFISPFTDTPGTNAGELNAEERIDVAVGLLGSFQGRNVVYRKVYANTYSFETQRASASSEPIPAPISFPPPVLTPDGLRPLLTAEKAIWSLPEPERNRVHLSLKCGGRYGREVAQQRLFIHRSVSQISDATRRFRSTARRRRSALAFRAEDRQSPGRSGRPPRCLNPFRKAARGNRWLPAGA